MSNVMAEVRRVQRGRRGLRSCWNHEEEVLVDEQKERSVADTESILELWSTSNGDGGDAVVVLL